MRGAAIVLVLGAWALAACEKEPGQRVADDVQTMKSERTPDKLFERGRAFASVGDYTRAEQYLAAALDAGGDDAVVLPMLLKVCIGAHRYRVAIDYATPALRRHPSDAHLRFLVASLRANVGDVTGARGDLAKVVEQTPGDPAARFAYAVLLRDQCGDPGAADAQFREYLRLAPTGEHAEEARASLLGVVEPSKEPSSSRELKAVP